MTTNETSFFRDKTPFEEMKARLLPPLFDARRGSKTLRIWCAAASSGQEPYSLALMLVDSFPQYRDWNIEILATDLNEKILAKAAEGLYSQFEVQRGLPIQMLVKYFQQHPQGWVLQDSIRRRVKFQKFNLLDSFRKFGQFDIILCRNVLIYFDAGGKQQILDRMAEILRPDGFLLMGAAETVLGVTEKLARIRLQAGSAYVPAASVAMQQSRFAAAAVPA